MAGRVVLNQAFRQFSLSSKIFIVSVKYPTKLPLLLKVEGGSSSFARNFSKPSDEISSEPNSESDPALVVDQKDASKMRNCKIPVEVGMKYLKSQGYASTYGLEPVWVKYRRNFKGQFAPETRKTCIRQEKLSTGNPCPICRDEYLVLDYQNVELLKQFISPFNGAILPTQKTGLCQSRQRELLVAITKAKDYGLITFDIPVREYDYSEYRT